MRKLPPLALVILGMLATTTNASLQTTSFVDLGRYVGTWYEIARFPNRFQRNCIGDVTAEYTRRSDGKIAVVNTCKKSNGALSQARGTAKIADSATNSKLKVTFFWPFYGDYWILDFAPDYSYAIIGEPKRKYLWILSRTPIMDSALYEKLLQRIAAMGYDPKKLVKTPQSEGQIVKVPA